MTAKKLITSPDAETVEIEDVVEPETESAPKTGYQGKRKVKGAVQAQKIKDDEIK